MVQHQPGALPVMLLVLLLLPPHDSLLKLPDSAWACGCGED